MIIGALLNHFVRHWLSTKISAVARARVLWNLRQHIGGDMATVVELYLDIQPFICRPEKLPRWMLDWLRGIGKDPQLT
jgi:hypothetical protein